MYLLRSYCKLIWLVIEEEYSRMLDIVVVSTRFISTAMQSFT